MSGHSKWRNIKVKKSKVDAKKGKVFTKVAREIFMAVREGGTDSAINYRLKIAVSKAKDVNMPGDNIKRTIDKAGGTGNTTNYEEVTYEGYGPHGIAVLLETATDNRNRTAADIRNIFSKHGGNLGESGCVAWMFDKVGLITIPADKIQEEKLIDIALEAGANDMRQSENIFEVTTSIKGLQNVKQALTDKGVPFDSAEITMVAKSTCMLQKEQARAILKLTEELEDHDDVQQVYSNFDIPSSILEELSVEL